MLIAIALTVTVGAVLTYFFKEEIARRDRLDKKPLVVKQPHHKQREFSLHSSE